MKEFNYNSKRKYAPDHHMVVKEGGDMVDIGLDLRSLSEDDYEEFCHKCGNILPLDRNCDCEVNQWLE